MKKFLFLIFLNGFYGIAQIPINYYSTATGTGYTLKTQVHNIIKNYNPQSYNSLWNLYTHVSYRDNYYDNDGSLLDIYSEKVDDIDSNNYTSTTQQCGSTSSSLEGDCYNREHLIPESFFQPYFNSIGVNTSINSLAYYTKNDAHFIPPTDIRVNAWRGNLPFGRVFSNNPNPCYNQDPSSLSPDALPCKTTNNSKIGFNNNSGYSEGTGNGVNVFEPIDEFKGDIARAVLYFATRYEDVLPLMYSTCSNTSAKAMFDGSSSQGLNAAFLNIMKTWHQNDPVSAREIAINNRIYAHQSNRNPFIDHPEWVAAIWGATLNTVAFNALDAISIFPNPTNNNKISIQSELVIDEINLINSNGQLVQQIEHPMSVNNLYTLENLTQGFYLLKITSNEQSSIRKIIIN